MNEQMSELVVNAITDVKLLIKEDGNRTIDQIKSLETKIDALSTKQNDMSTRLVLAENKIDSTKKSLDENWAKTRKYDEKLIQLKEDQDGKREKENKIQDIKIENINKNMYKAVGAISIIAGLVQLGIIKLT